MHQEFIERDYGVDRRYPSKLKAQPTNYSNRFATEFGRIKFPLTNRCDDGVNQEAITRHSLNRSNIALFVHAHFDQHFSLHRFSFRRQNRTGQQVRRYSPG